MITTCHLVTIGKQYEMPKSQKLSCVTSETTYVTFGSSTLQPVCQINTSAPQMGVWFPSPNLITALVKMGAFFATGYLTFYITDKISCTPGLSPVVTPTRQI